MNELMILTEKALEVRDKALDKIVERQIEAVIAVNARKDMIPGAELPVKKMPEPKDKQCPKCRSAKVIVINENMLCLNCGYQEYLYDYLNSFDTPSDSVEDNELSSKIAEFEQQLEIWKLPELSKLYNKCQQLQKRQNYLQLQLDNIKRMLAGGNKKERFKYE